MNIRKAIGSLLGALALGALAAAPSLAQTQQTFASATGTGANASTVFNYSGGPTGTFTTPGTFFGVFLPTSTPSAPDTLTFTGFAATLPATGTGTPLDPYTQGLGAGTFSLKDSTSTVLLSGNFLSGDILSYVTGSTTASITNSVNNVTYTGGTYFTASGLKNPGSFSISMTSVTPAPTVPTTGPNAGYLTGFTAGGTGAFSATTSTSVVPESSGIANMSGALLAALLSMGFIALKRRSAKSTTNNVAG